MTGTGGRRWGDIRETTQITTLQMSNLSVTWADVRVGGGYAAGVKASEVSGATHA